MGQRGEGGIWRGANKICLCRVSLLGHRFATIPLIIALDTALVPHTFVMN